jgi:phytoene dehydrogenase-like protein
MHAMADSCSDYMQPANIQRVSAAKSLMNVVQAGGRAQTVQHGAFRFDTGPSLLLFPDTYRQVQLASYLPTLVAIPLRSTCDQASFCLQQTAADQRLPVPTISPVLQAFEALGTQIEEHVELVQVGPAAYRVHFEGGSHLDLLNDVSDMQRQLEAEEPGAGGHC